MENNIQNQLHEEEILNPGQFSAASVSGDDDLQIDAQADPENEDMLGGTPDPETIEDDDDLEGDDFEEVDEDDNDLDLGDADGSGGKLESDDDLED